MSLRDRLQSLNLPHKSRSDSTSIPSIPDGGAGTDLAPQPASPPGKGELPFARQPWLARFEGALGGVREAGPAGEIHVVRTRHPIDLPHGDSRLADFLGLTPPGLALLGNDPQLGSVALDRVAFLDCETTGLAGGTGTKAFLVGLAYFEETDLPPLSPFPAGKGEKTLVVEQHFLPDYDAEAAFLAGLGATLDRFDWLVTFNGKAFDLPLLETRLAFARQEADWLDYPHLDLLHPARRVWRRRLESCGLGALETATLGVARAGDVPGWLIPTLYFNFLQNGRFGPLEPVFYHNRIDLLSLVALAVRLARLVGGEESPAHPLDVYSLGRLLEDRGEAERAVAAFEHALAGELSAADREEVGFRLGRLYKRLRRDDAALVTWRALSADFGERSLSALVELAKHQEHRARDYPRAAEATRRALVVLALRPEMATGGEVSVAALEKRLLRLEGKLSREQAK